MEYNNWCEQSCTNLVGNYSCSCGSDYSLAKDGRSCLGNNVCCYIIIIINIIIIIIIIVIIITIINYYYYYNIYLCVFFTARPQNTMVTYAPLTTLKLEWEPPQLNLRDGILISYTMSCTSSRLSGIDDHPIT